MTDTQDTAPDLCTPEHFEAFRGEVARSLDAALLHYTSTGTGPGPEKWRNEPRATVAERLAVTLTAGIAPLLDRHTHRSVLGTLAELQRPANRYMRPRDPAEERRRFWVPEQAAQARAMEKLAECAAPERLCAFIPLVQPGKAFEVWTHGQEIITVRPVVIIASRSHEGPGLAFSAARSRTFEIARTALNGEPGTVAAAVVLPDGQFQVFECGPGGELGSREVQVSA